VTMQASYTSNVVCVQNNLLAVHEMELSATHLNGAMSQGSRATSCHIHAGLPQEGAGDVAVVKVQACAKSTCYEFPIHKRTA
jgi:hypothetical protein